MVVFYDNNLYYGAKCEPLEDNLMICKTPSLNNITLDKRQSLTSAQPLRIDYSFDLDGTMTGFVLNI